MARRAPAAPAGSPAPAPGTTEQVRYAAAMAEGLTREALDAMLAAGLAAYDDDVRAAWARIRIEPAKWRCSPWGDETGGFWAVAVEDDHVLWYNDIEDGFNRSPFSHDGTIGEYGSGQTELAHFLDQIARDLSAGVWGAGHARGLPADLAGSGTIAQRQTTYWELHAAAGARYRVHLRGTAETGFAAAQYPSVELTSHHPLLVQHSAPSRSLYFTGAPRDPGAVAAALDHVVRDGSDGWRSLPGYAGPVEATLRRGHGLFMVGPEPVCVAVAAVLEDAAIRTSILGDVAARAAHQALVLGRSYVVAQAFAFERRTS